MSEHITSEQNAELDGLLREVDPGYRSAQLELLEGREDELALTLDELTGLIDEAKNIEEIKVALRHLTRQLFGVSKRQAQLAQNFARLSETSVPDVTAAQRRAGRFLRKGKHATKPHEWVVINDPQYVVFCDDKSAALSLGFTNDEISEARRAMQAVSEAGQGKEASNG